MCCHIASSLLEILGCISVSVCLGFFCLFVGLLLGVLFVCFIKNFKLDFVHCCAAYPDTCCYDHSEYN